MARFPLVPTAPAPAHLESAVTDVLHEIGVPAHVKGYQYLREGILFTIRGADPTAGITKVLYPTVAKKFSSTPSCVERSMRRAIHLPADVFHSCRSRRRRSLCAITPHRRRKRAPPKPRMKSRSRSYSRTRRNACGVPLKGSAEVQGVSK